jgi:hypothetical protein
MKDCYGGKLGDQLYKHGLINSISRKGEKASYKFLTLFLIMKINKNSLAFISMHIYNKEYIIINGSECL